MVKCWIHVHGSKSALDSGHISVRSTASKEEFDKNYKDSSGILVILPDDKPHLADVDEVLRSIEGESAEIVKDMDLTRGAIVYLHMPQNERLFTQKKGGVSARFNILPGHASGVHVLWDGKSKNNTTIILNAALLCIHMNQARGNLSLALTVARKSLLSEDRYTMLNKIAQLGKSKTEKLSIKSVLIECSFSDELRKAVPSTDFSGIKIIQPTDAEQDCDLHVSMTQLKGSDATVQSMREYIRESREKVKQAKIFVTLIQPGLDKSNIEVCFALATLDPSIRILSADRLNVTPSWSDLGKKVKPLVKEALADFAKVPYYFLKTDSLNPHDAISRLAEAADGSRISKTSLLQTLKS
jgi:hypothetical protein